MDEPRPVAAALASVAFERARFLGPLVWVGIVFSVAVSTAIGIPLAGPVIAWNVTIIVAIGALVYALARRKLPERHGHALLALLWMIPVGGTLLSQYYSGSNLLAMTLLVEIATLAIMLDTRWVVGCLLALDLLWAPIAVRDLGSQAGAVMANVFGAELFSVIVHLLMRTSLVRAESHRAAEAATARELAAQVAALERSHADRDQLQDQLLHAQRMEATGTLAAGLAHDMNNVLASISMVAELRRDGVADPAEREDLAQILAQAERGAELTRGLLAFGRRGQYRKQVLSIDDTIRDVVPILSRTLPKAIELRASLDVRDARVEGDPAQLQQVLVNLGVNAADAMAGNGQIAIATTVVELAGTIAAEVGLAPGRYVRITFADTGQGMDEPTRRRVFEPFFTTKPLGKGTGLGLATVWGVVQSHGGVVGVTSRLGRGTTFTIHLPITTAALVARHRTPSTAPATADAATVLLVDDEPVVRASTTRLLERQGFHVVTAANGAEGLSRFYEHADAIGLVILDMGMPVMSGAECFERIRERSAVPVLVATGYAIDAEAQALIARGAALIEKPFRGKELLNEVARLLRRTENEGPDGGEVGKPSSVSWRSFI